jgi:hypothetical protein
MARYRFLQNHVMSDGSYLEAGDIADLPGWKPTAAVEPLDQDAIQAFWNAGPQLLPLVRAQQTLVDVNAPAIYWERIDALNYILTGAGAALGPRKVDAPLELLP